MNAQVVSKENNVVKFTFQVGPEKFEEGMKYAKEIEKMFNIRCTEFKQENKLNFGVYYTPAESLCGTALRKFKKDFSEFF